MKSRLTIYSMFKLICLIFLVTGISGCGYFVANAKQEFAEDLATTIMEFDDPETIQKGLPAYLILISSMIKGDPDNPDILESGARLYGAYASSFTDSTDSKKALASRAFNYSGRAMCIRNQAFCDVENISYFEFEKRLETVEESQIESLFIYVSSWASVIEANSADWNMVAELPKVKAGLQQVLDTDEAVSNGNAHVYMAVMESLLPATLGGKPEMAKKHFDRAIEISRGTNLMAKVLYAEKYARLVFDRELHDSLLQQVVNADAGSEDQILINTLARQKAAWLLQDADDYF
jgi:hypothetical protein